MKSTTEEVFDHGEFISIKMTPYYKATSMLRNMAMCFLFGIIVGGLFGYLFLQVA